MELTACRQVEYRRPLGNKEAERETALSKQGTERGVMIDQWQLALRGGCMNSDFAAFDAWEVKHRSEAYGLEKTRRDFSTWTPVQEKRRASAIQAHHVAPGSGFDAPASDGAAAPLLVYVNVWNGLEPPGRVAGTPTLKRLQKTE